MGDTPLRHLSRWDQFWDEAHRALTPRAWPATLASWLSATTEIGVERHEIAVPAFRSDHPLRIAFASDFHAGPTTPARLLEAAVERLAEVRPDVLLLGGDFVSVAAEDARLLVARLATIPAPFGRYAVLGNHDHDSNGLAMASLLGAAGIKVLTNRNVRLPPPFDAISLCGLDDHTRGAPDARAAVAETGPVRIVVMHAPSGLLDIGVQAFSLALCGHTLLVSRGVGYTALPVRVNAPPAITVCTLRPGA